jgi:hypothetical protein
MHGKSLPKKLIRILKVSLKIDDQIYCHYISIKIAVQYRLVINFIATGFTTSYGSSKQA